ncbi:MAG TPA: DUF488 domain-containing protein [Acidimicrobiales bacterium]|nr:DUF488 domain-containing protein [Acidimicrobiales bacterium]
MVLYTVGHGARTGGELIAVLADAGVGRLADVRRFPVSARHPHLAGAALSATMREGGIAYEWWGEELGGRRRSAGAASRHPAWRDPAFRAYADHMDTSVFRAALNRLSTSAHDDPPLAVMCAETLWWRCHRRLIADAAVLRGTPVVHLLDVRKAQPHPLHPAVRAGCDGWPVYDLGAERPLEFPEG